ncbi:hypothetical protein PRIEUP_LOCUS109, partial [Pristimantis euphronides]
RARAGRNPPVHPRSAEAGREASLQAAPSPPFVRRAAVRGGPVVRPGDVPAGGSARSRRTTSAEVANKRSRRQPAGGHRCARDDGRRHRGRGRAPRVQQDTSESSDSGENGEGSSAADTAAEAQETSEESSGADERTEGRVGAAGGPAGPSQPGKSNSTSNLQTVANVGSSGGRPPGLVWIIGHSYVYWGAQLADRRWEGRQLGISREVAGVRWIGVRGMQWGRMFGEIQRFVNLDGKPNIIVLH